MAPSFLQPNAPWVASTKPAAEVVEMVVETDVTSKDRGKKCSRDEDTSETETEGEKRKKKKKGKVSKKKGRRTRWRVWEICHHGQDRHQQHEVLQDISNAVINSLLVSALSLELENVIDPALLAVGMAPGLFIPNCGPNDCPNPFTAQPPPQADTPPLSPHAELDLEWLALGR
ncbi:hypothetical protein ARMSODRAFT_1023768 [Armillaria solidipes]|uniref:Uncharacterized protein n=1 Tax=Armillaria solidipes TaxID=1076256 RepID=A0A2H3AXZ2_9AGAR|nr:hypothetical protein ARMSODRAFT_1023768 [Armillaria solidipes]